MKNEIQKLVESFGENSRIGDVLEKIVEQEKNGDKVYWIEMADGSFYKELNECEAEYSSMQVLLLTWGKLGFTKSLQSIFEEAEWEERFEMRHHTECDMVNHRAFGCKLDTELQIKQPHIRELFQFLLSLNL